MGPGVWWHRSRWLRARILFRFFAQVFIGACRSAAPFFRAEELIEVDLPVAVAAGACAAAARRSAAGF
jgi:hypothetical protein